MRLAITIIMLSLLSSPALAAKDCRLKGSHCKIRTQCDDKGCRVTFG